VLKSSFLLYNKELLTQGGQKMKKLLSVLMVTAFVCSIASTPVLAGDAGDKLSEGFKQAITSPKNIPDSLQEEYEVAEFKPFGLIGGVVKGVTMTIVDFGLGLVKVVTFPVDLDGN
jgi:hypothetical protein